MRRFKTLLGVGVCLGVLNAPTMAFAQNAVERPRTVGPPKLNPMPAAPGNSATEEGTHGHGGTAAFQQIHPIPTGVRSTQREPTTEGTAPLKDETGVAAHTNSDAQGSPPTNSTWPWPATPSLTSEDVELGAAQKQLVIAQLKREIEKLKEMESELAYYNWMGRVMFLVVHGVLAMGLYMAWVEFAHAKRSRGKAKTSVQELSLSLEGVALKTALHGSFILALAFAFYFAYVKFVYPLVVIP